MNVLNRALAQGLLLRHGVKHKLKRILKADDVQMFAQGLFGNGDAVVKNQRRFPQRDGVTLNRIGIVAALDDEFVA